MRGEAGGSVLPTLMPGAHISFGVVRKKGESARSAKVNLSSAASGGFSCSCITLMLAKLVPAPHACDQTRDKLLKYRKKSRFWEMYVAIFKVSVAPSQQPVLAWLNQRD